MAVKFKHPRTIEITNDVIATVVGGARQIFTELSEWQAKSN